MASADAAAVRTEDEPTTAAAAAAAASDKPHSLDILPALTDKKLDKEQEQQQLDGIDGAGTATSTTAGATTAADDARAKDAEEQHQLDPAYVRVPLSRVAFGLVFLCLILSLLLAALDQTIVATALLVIVKDLGKQELVSWIGTAYLISATAVTLIYGNLADLFGRKWVFVFAIVMFEVGSLLCGIASSMEVLIIGRGVAGIGGGGIFSLIFIIVSDIVSIQDRGKYQGVFGATFGLSSLIGPLIGGGLSDAGLWRWCFFINIPAGVITVIVVILFLNFPPPEGTMRENAARIDYIGAAIIAVGVSLFVTPLQLGGAVWAWSAPQTIAMFCAAAVLLAAFLYVENKVAKFPMVPPAMFTDQSVVALLVIAVFLGGSFLSSVYYLALFFQINYGVSATVAGLKSVPLVGGVVVLAILSGVLVSRTGQYVLWLFVGPVIALGGLIATSFLTADSPLAQQVVFILIIGVGFGCVLQIRVIGIQAAVPPRFIAIATASSQFFQTLGSTVGIAIAGTVLNNALSSQIASHPTLKAVLSRPPFNAFDSNQVVVLRELLAAQVGKLPDAAQALQELLESYTAAYSTTLRVVLVFPCIMFAAAFFVKQRVIKAQGPPVAVE
ncbi:major facilitator superfamily domain-containing protein [Zopfochytrium polystomum]|nr:major facilitator superfamily domain-containing protein [Zopfochytrium polystomum]